MRKHAGVSLVILAGILWGISGGLADILMTRGWSPVTVSFYRGAVGWFCFVIWFLFRFKKNITSSVTFYLWSLLAGIGVAGNFSLYFVSIQHASVPVAATLMYTAPVFVLTTSIILKIERSRWYKWAGIAVVLLGIVLLTGAYDLESISMSLVGTSAGLGAGLSYALFIFGFKKASSIGKRPAVLTSAFLTFSLILFLFMDRGEAFSVLSSSDFGWFLLLGIIGAGLSFTVYVIGLQKTAPTTASMVAMVEPVTASLFGVLFLNNALTMIQVTGMALILVTITLLSAKKSRE
ncbi:EamA-like transporter family protein [Alkalibacterium subtropicum]|uniref:EamA-like transporter family protein n=1 Tax=Alkalibacterium subtropicum TaxID=753702 RepID=A0A1I1G0D9_9LACT|nr:DMT family transporter [Alkalibacterium subtropicum]SFC05074.1 EamA-like transporter family protein [Alkalibacterium subtropicum]